MWPDAAAHRVPLALRGGTGSKKRLLRFPKWEIRMDRTGRDSKGRIWGYFFFKIYLFLAALGLRCCVQAFSGCRECRF